MRKVLSLGGLWVNGEESAFSSGAFDAFAESYDDDFSETDLGRILRRRVWEVLERRSRAGEHWLELACGTGVDAAWMAGRGVRMTCGDGSAAMLRQTQTRARRLNLPIDTVQLDLAQPPAFATRFDGVLSNFGGLNTIPDLRPLAARLADCVRVGGSLVLVPMGKHCPWETAWYAAHGDFGRALRRYRQPAIARIGSAVIPIWYPSLKEIEAAFGEWFGLKSADSLGLLLPPTYLEKVTPAILRLDKIERRISRWFPAVGDHLILVFERLP